MDKEQAYNAFWSGFGVLAWEENSMPDDKDIQSLIEAGYASAKYPYNILRLPSMTSLLLGNELTSLPIPSLKLFRI